MAEEYEPIEDEDETYVTHPFLVSLADAIRESGNKTVEIGEWLLTADGVMPLVSAQPCDVEICIAGQHDRVCIEIKLTRGDGGSFEAESFINWEHPDACDNARRVLAIAGIHLAEDWTYME